MQLHIKNFRSIENLSLHLAPITLLYGHNGTGKSTALYAPLTLKNIVTNPMQPVDDFFQYGFANLGTFQEVIFDHDKDRPLELGISFAARDYLAGFNGNVNYRISCFSDNTGTFDASIVVAGARLSSPEKHVTFPYDLRDHSNGGVHERISWNGISAVSAEETSPEEFDPNLDAEIESLNLPPDILKKVDFVPLGRGFFQPSYTFQEVSPSATKENDVSSLIAGNRHLRHKISLRLERVLHRQFQTDNEMGTLNFSMSALDKKSMMSASLVNDGFGVNQLVYMLAKVLNTNTGIVCIEEPEIHLHPTAIRRLARELSDIVHEDGSKRRLLISTHSEQFIRAFTTLVAEEECSPDNLALYLVTKEGKTSQFTRNNVNEKGQIEGGLRSFIEGELEDLKVFLGLRENAGNATREANVAQGVPHSDGDV